MGKSNDSWEYFSYESREDLPSPIKKFLKYLKGEGPFFFDVYEFENIIEYFLSYQDYDLAKKAIEAAQYFYPDEKEFFFLKAQLLFRKGESQKALNLLQNIKSFYSGDPEFYFLVANIFLAQNKFDKALRFYNKVLKNADIKEIDYYLMLIADSLSIVKKYNEALEFLYKIPEKHRSNSILAKISDNLQKLGKTAEAEKYLLKIIKRDPTSESWWNKLGMFYENIGKINKAIDAYLNSFALSQNPEEYNDTEYDIENIYFQIEEELKLADLLYENKQYQKAFLFYEHIGQYKSQKPYYFGMAECLINLNRINDAENLLYEAIQKGETTSDILFGLAKVAYEKKEFANAVKYINDAIKEEEKAENENIRKAELYNFKARTLSQIKQYNDALEYYAKAVVLSKLDKEYLKDFSEFVMSKGNIGRILRTLAKDDNKDEQKVVAKFITERLKLYFIAENKKFNEKRIKALIYNIIRNRNK